MVSASKKVLITGIDSFSGYHLSSYLQNRGYDVYGTSLFIENEKVFKCDITSKSSIKSVFEKLDIEYIIHLSAISFVGHSNLEDFYKVNTIGTLNILDVLVELNKKPKKIILASSATIYGNQGKEILDESMCPLPANHYGASKYAMETMAKNYANKFDIIITRPFNYTGIKQSIDFLIPKIVSHYKDKKDTIELGNLDVMREFNDVSYVCEVYEKLLNCNHNFEIVNVCSNRGIKLLDVISMMNDIAKYEIKVSVNPAFVRKDEIKSLTGSTDKLYGMIGEIVQKDIMQTLKEMFEA